MTPSARAPAQPENRTEGSRSLALGLAGAALGLGLAGYGLFTARGTVVRAVPAEDAALVNQRPILASDYAAQVQAAAGKPLDQASPEERRRVLDDMIREELLVQRGLELDEPGTDPDTRAALVAAVQAQVAVDATSQVPPQADLERTYQAHRTRYTRMGSMRVRDLLVLSSSPAAAAAALRATHEAGPAIAAGTLRDTGATQGEELDFAAAIHLGPALFAAASALRDGGVAGPVAMPDGAHILLMIHRTPPQPRSYEQARSQVYSDYKEDLIARLRDSEYGYLRGRADIQIAAPDAR